MSGFVVALVVSAPFLFVLALRPVQRRIAARNALRRPVESLLVIAGTMLGTAIITGSLVVGDTIDRSIRASAYEQLGPVDETIAVSGLDAGAELQDALAGFENPDVDGVLALSTAPASVVGPGDGSRSRPKAQIVEVDFAAARRFGDDPVATGIRGATPQPGAAAITTDLADAVGAGPGDTITVNAYGRATPLTVDRVLPRLGIAGFWTIDPTRASHNVLVAPGTLRDLVATSADPDVEPPTAYVAVSNVGGVESGADLTDPVRAALARELDAAGIDARVVPAKRDRIELAVEGADALTQLYFTMGMFAVAAGVLLLVNIFVMLADDRRSELGMIRALGLRRFPLVTTFATEGWIYAVIASALGAALGIGVGRVIAWRADVILSSGREADVLDLQFSFDWPTVVTGLAIGLAISMLTIVLTSVRTARINVIAAIRELPDTRTRGDGRRRSVLAVAAVVVAVVLTAMGFAGPDQYALILGPPLLCVGVGLLLHHRVPQRTLVTTTGGTAFVWATAAVPLGAGLGAPLDIPIFLIQGLLMSAAAITVVVAQEDRVARGLATLSGDALPLRVGLAYPLARRFRTAMTLGMFSIVVLTLVFMSQLVGMFNGQADTITTNLSGGFGAVVTSNPSDPLTPAQVESVPGVERVAPLAFQYATWTRPEGEPTDWPVSGFGPELVASPPRLTDRGAYRSDRAAWEAVRTDPTLLIADEFFATPNAGPPPRQLQVGDHVRFLDPLTGNRRTLTVAAIAEDDYLFSGPYVGIETLRALMGDRIVPSRYFVGARDLDAAVHRIRTQFIANGADGDTVAGLVDQLFSQNSAFFTLMQQFVGVGLVIGIAGIGVIMVRAVRERRREVGVLRAIGFPRRTVARSFVVEASFVAVAGTVMGVLIALVATWGLTLSSASWARGLAWRVEWGDIGVITALAVVASLVAAVLPARAASAIRPAAALRIAD